MVIVAGAADAIVPVGSSARSYAADIPQADLTIFPGECRALRLCRGLHASRACHPSCAVHRRAGRRPPHDSREDGGLAEVFFARHLR